MPLILNGPLTFDEVDHQLRIRGWRGSFIVLDTGLQFHQHERRRRRTWCSSVVPTLGDCLLGWFDWLLAGCPTTAREAARRHLASGRREA